MSVYLALGVQQTTFPVAAAERRGRRSPCPRSLVNLCSGGRVSLWLVWSRRRHPADAAGRGCPWAPRGCQRRAAPRGRRDGQRCNARARLPPQAAPARI